MTMIASLLLLIAQDQLPAESLDHFDLATIPKREPGCGSAASPATDVVVCGRKTMDLPVDGKAYREVPKRVLGADAHVEAEQRVLPGGISGPALMFTLKWPF